MILNAPAKSRRLFTNGVSVGNGADLTADTLHSFTIAAGQLANVGDTIQIKTGGALGATTDVKTPRIAVGGQTVITGAYTGVGQTSWWGDVTLTKTGSNTQSYVATLQGQTGTAKTLAGTLSLTDTSAIVILVTGQNSTNSVAGSITAQLTTVFFN